MERTVTNTPGILFLAKNARGRNRSIDEKRFSRSVDPDGVHVLAYSMIHNDKEMRTLWYCKLRHDETPASVWLDVDFDALKTACVKVEE